LSSSCRWPCSSACALWNSLQCWLLAKSQVMHPFLKVVEAHPVSTQPPFLLALELVVPQHTQPCGARDSGHSKISDWTHI
jgi:hypothetical protein